MTNEEIIETIRVIQSHYEVNEEATDIDAIEENGIFIGLQKALELLERHLTI